MDNCPENFSLQKENGIFIKSWYGDTADTTLITLETMMIRMATTKCEDVRKYLKANIPKNLGLGLALYN